jgi:hypothetical protein
MRPYAFNLDAWHSFHIASLSSIASEPVNTGNVNVYNTGETDYYPSVTYQSTCAMDMARFPFDEQNCTFKFSSWSYTDDELSLDFYEGVNQNNVDLNHYVPNSDWSLVATGASRNFNSDNGFDYYDLMFFVVIRRRPGFYLYVLVVPSLLLSLLTPGLFWIPPSRPDRTTLGMITYRDEGARSNSLVVLPPADVKSNCPVASFC